MSSHDVYAHEESWLLLPWLANGRLAASERVRVEEVGDVNGLHQCAERSVDPPCPCGIWVPIE